MWDDLEGNESFMPSLNLGNWRHWQEKVSISQISFAKYSRKFPKPRAMLANESHAIAVDSIAIAIHAQIEVAQPQSTHSKPTQAAINTKTWHPWHAWQAR